MGCGEGAAAVGEEVGVERGDAGAEDAFPLLNHPLGVLGQVEWCLVGIRGARAGQRPGKGMPVHFAAGLGRKRIDDRQQGDQRGGKAFREQFAGRCEVDVLWSGRSQVADQYLVPRRRRADRSRGAGDSREGLQGGVNLTEFDAPAAKLDLFIRAALEDEAGFLVADEVAGAVCAFPPQGRHGGVLFGVLGRIEVAGQSDAADDQFACLAFRDGNTGSIDDGEVPAVQRQSDPHRAIPA